MGTSDTGVNDSVFENCPYGCNRGRYFNVVEKKWAPCPNCTPKLSDFAKGKTTDTERSASDVLRIPENYTGMLFDAKKVIPESAKKDLKASSILDVENYLTSLMNKADMGEVSDCSVMVNLGRKSRENIFIVPYLLRSMSSGLSVAPLLIIPTLEEYRARFEISPLDDTAKEWGMKYKDYLSADVCVITIDAGVTPYGLDAVKGLMQVRASLNKSTIIFTNAWGNRVRALCSEDGDNEKYLATLVSVEYDGNFIKNETKGIRHTANLGISGTSYDDIARR